MTIADNLTALANQKLGYQQEVEDVKAAIRLKKVNVPESTKLGDIAGLVGEIKTTGDWIRPSDWLEIDSLVTPGEQKTVLLCAIYPNDNNLGFSNSVAFQITGNHTVDWGDGIIENYNSNVQAQHIYNYDSLSASTDCARGYRQVIITITAQNLATITSVQLGRRHSSFPYGMLSSQYLDAIISGTHISSFRVGSPTAPILIEKFKIIQSTQALTNLSSSLSACYSIQSVDFSQLNTTNCTAVTSLFESCYSLKKVDISSFVATNITNLRYLFLNCYQLLYVKLPLFTNITDALGMFYGCYTLQDFDNSKIITQQLNNATTLFYSCRSLKNVDFSHTTFANVTSVDGIFNVTGSLSKIRLPNIKISFTISGNPLSATALNELFTDLYDLTGQPSQTITITGCLGAATCNKTIATNKNWTVIG